MRGKHFCLPLVQWRRVRSCDSSRRYMSPMGQLLTKAFSYTPWMWLQLKKDSTAICCTTRISLCHMFSGQGTSAGKGIKKVVPANYATDAVHSSLRKPLALSPWILKDMVLHVTLRYSWCLCSAYLVAELTHHILHSPRLKKTCRLQID